MNKMSAAVSRSEHQRAWGDLVVEMRLRDGRTVIGDLRQDGCMKARFPRPVDIAEIITLNSSGGVVGGDRLRSTLKVGAGAQACFASQAAERFYRALDSDPSAEIRTSVDVASGGLAEWLPQESILFDRCALNRRLDVTLAEDATFIGVEALIFGRAAMGESVVTARLADRITVRRNGTLILHEAIRVDGPVADLLARPAIGAGARAVATLIYVAADAHGRLDVLRAAWDDSQAECGASAWNGMLVGRVVAGDGARLRRAVIAGLAVLRDGRALPRVWNC
jgi:urease accessory protein